MKVICDRCLKEYPESDIGESKYFPQYSLCIRCDAEYECRLNIFRSDFMNEFMETEYTRPKPKKSYKSKIRVVSKES